MSSLNGEERVLATAQHILRSLGTTETMTGDMLEILSKFDNRFSDLLPMKQSNASELPDGLMESLDAAEEVVVHWDRASSENARNSRIWESAQEEAANYLHAVDDVQNILDSLSLSEAKSGFDRAQNLLQMSMLRLEEEFRHLLDVYSGPIDLDMLLNSCARSTTVALHSLSSEASIAFDIDGAVESESEIKEEESSDGDEEVPVAQPVTDLNPLLDLLPLPVVQDLHDIAKRMVQAQYKRECCHTYGSVRKAILEESFQRLGVEKLSIDEVQKMPWDLLQEKIRSWIQAMNVGVKVLFPSERQLCDQVFEDLPGDVGVSCFAEFTKGVMMQLLNFGEAIAISRRSSEKLFTILDMYEVLRELLPEIHSVFTGEGCVTVRDEAGGVVLRLGEAARGTFAEFENAIYRDPPKTPVPGGALHPLTRYVMNYLRLVLVYMNTWKHLLGDRSEAPFPPGGTHGEEGESSSFGAGGGSGGGSGSGGGGGGGGEDGSQQEQMSPLAVQLVWIIHVLQSNLDNKAKLYKDLALTYLFLMNNVHYIVYKVKTSEIGPLLGDDWVRKHTLQVRQYATSYQRSAWVKVLGCLKDEGIRASGSFSSGVSKAVLKDRFKSFNAAFEEIHKTQSLWTVFGNQLRAELRISIAEKLVPAYRAFLGRYRIYLENERHPNKYIKYTPEELETLLNDLFEGTPPARSLSR